MSEVMEMYEKIAVRKSNIQKIQRMLKEGLQKEIICKFGYTEDEYREAEEMLLKK